MNLSEFLNIKFNYRNGVSEETLYSTTIPPFPELAPSESFRPQIKIENKSMEW
jgi:hypothetical protein